MLKKTILFSIILLYLFLSPAYLIEASPIEWRVSSDGLYGGTVTSLASVKGKDNIIYAGTINAGIFKSTDGGESWQKVNNGLPLIILSDKTVYDLATAGDNIVYAAIGGYFFRSTDGGKSWTNYRQVEGLTGRFQNINHLLPAGDSGEVIYAGSRGEGLFKSVNGGLSWIKLNYQGNFITGLAVDNDNTVYVSSAYGLIAKSTDGGKSWRRIDNSLPRQEGNIQSIVIAGASRDRLYVAIYGGGVFKSADGGKSWIGLNEGLPDLWVRKVLAVGKNGGTLYLRTESGYTYVRDEDKGDDSWRKFDLEKINYPILSLLTVGDQGNIIYAGCGSGGIYKSTDEGDSWEERNRGLIALDIKSIVISSTSKVYLGTYGAGVFQAEDTAWRTMNEGSKDIYIEKIKLDEDENNLYLISLSGRIYKRGLSEEKWEIVSDNLLNNYLLDIIPPNEKGLSYLGIYNFGVLRSEDGGATWSPSKTIPPGIERMTIVKNGDIIYINSGYRDIYRSPDGEGSWQKMTTEGLPEDNIISLTATENGGKVFVIIPSYGIYGYFADEEGWQKLPHPSERRDWEGIKVIGEKVYVWNDTEVFSSPLESSEWTEIAPNKISGTITALTGKDNTLYLGTQISGIYKFERGRWEKANKGLPQVLHSRIPEVAGLAVTGEEAQIIYAVLYESGKGKIYKSTNGGKSWKGLKAPNFSSLYSIEASGAKGKEVYITTNSGLHRSLDGGENWRSLESGLPREADTRLLSLISLSEGKDILYLTVSSLSGGSQLYRSLDKGDNWTLVNPYPQDVSALLAERGNERIYAGTFATGGFKSGDRGNNWQKMNGLPAKEIIYALIKSPKDNNTLYAGTSLGFFRSGDKGENWDILDNGLPPQARVKKLTAVISESGAEILLAAVGAKNGEICEVFKSEDGGSNWKKLGEFAEEIQSLALSPAGDLAYVGTNVVYIGRLTK